MPMDGFCSRRFKYNTTEEEQDPYMSFFRDADNLKDNWKLIKQGMFGGSYDRYKQIHNKADKFYKEHAEY